MCLNDKHLGEQSINFLYNIVMKVKQVLSELETLGNDKTKKHYQKNECDEVLRECNPSTCYP